MKILARCILPPTILRQGRALQMQTATSFACRSAMHPIDSAVDRRVSSSYLVGNGGEGCDVRSHRHVEHAVVIAALVGVLPPSASWDRSFWAKDVIYGWLGAPGYFQFDSSNSFRIRTYAPKMQSVLPA